MVNSEYLPLTAHYSPIHHSPFTYSLYTIDLFPFPPNFVHPVIRGIFIFTAKPVASEQRNVPDQTSPI